MVPAQQEKHMSKKGIFYFSKKTKELKKVKHGGRIFCDFQYKITVSRFSNFDFFNHIFIFVGIMGCFVPLAFAGAYAQKIVPGGHVVLKEDIFGRVGNDIYADNQLVLKIPFYQKGVTIRTQPVKKRFIKEYITQDGRNVEVRVLTRLQPKIHWIPEIYRNFGKDYGRGFLEKEATHDVSMVCKDYAYDSLLNNDVLAEKAAVHFILFWYVLLVLHCFFTFLLFEEDILERIYDASCYHKIKMDRDGTVITFVDPEVFF